MHSIVSNRFLFSFEGRINCLKYGYALFPSVISCLVFIGILAFAIGSMFGADVKSVEVGHFNIFSNPPSWPFSAGFSNAGPNATLISMLFYTAGTPVFVVSTWFLAATTVKRLHDRNKSGWWVVAFFIAPALFRKIGDRLGDSDAVILSYAAMLLMLAASVLNFWGLVELLFMKGTPGPNRFGPDPLVPVGDSAPKASRWDQHGELEFVPHSAGPPPGPHGMRGHE